MMKAYLTILLAESTAMAQQAIDRKDGPMSLWAACEVSIGCPFRQLNAFSNRNLTDPFGGLALVGPDFVELNGWPGRPFSRLPVRDAGDGPNRRPSPAGALIPA